jgi:hypothetical protein
MFYNFNNAGIGTNEIFKKYVQHKRIFALFLRPKVVKKVLMEANGRENKNIRANPYYSPLALNIHFSAHCKEIRHIVRKLISNKSLAPCNFIVELSLLSNV